MKRILSSFLALVMLLSVLVLPANAASLPFTDVPTNHKFYDYISGLYELGIMSGTSATTFSPNTNLSRAMFVTILGRVAGIDPDDYYGSSFSDVPVGRWDTPYIQWAAMNGIVNGVGDGKFSPTGEITVEQYCTIVDRFLKAYNIQLSVEVSSSKWPPALRDLNEASSYARTAVYDMFYYGMFPEWYYRTNDSSGVYVQPRDKATRAWVAASVYYLVGALFLDDGMEWYHDKPFYCEGVTTTVW